VFGDGSLFGILGIYFACTCVYLTDVDMNPQDPRWIGAWWLGFVIFGIVSLFLALPLALFPKQLKMSAKDTAKDKVQERIIVKECSFWDKLKGN
jgi:hypothetical protein